MEKSIWQELLFRLRSKVVWVAGVGFVVVVFNAYNLWPLIGIQENQFREITDALATLLIAFGFLNNPADRENF